MTPPHAHPADRNTRGSSRRQRRIARRERHQSRRERRRLTAILRTETLGGCLILAAAVLALALANSPASRLFVQVRDARLGPASLGLDLTVGQWSAEGLLAVFFFLAGLELKTEFVAGALRDIRRSAVPVLAAVGGMAGPAIVYLLVTVADPAARIGWAIPTATDIAFALAVLAVVGRNLPRDLRTFLLALAIVDDLLAIVIIAVFFASDLRLGYLAASLAAVALFAVVLRHCRRRIVLRRTLLTLAVVLAWALMLHSGVHATVAGVLLGFAVPVVGPRRRRRTSGHDAAPGNATATRLLPLGPMARRIDEALRPLSAGIAVPLFAFFAAGVTVGGLRGLVSAWGEPVTLGVVAGLLAGKSIGICATALVVGRLVHSPLLHSLALPDWIGVALVGGVGFTVSLLIGQLAFADDPARMADAQIGVVTGSVLSALLAAAVLGVRSRRYAAQARNDRSGGT